jgi:hypothetical protein
LFKLNNSSAISVTAGYILVSCQTQKEIERTAKILKKYEENTHGKEGGTKQNQLESFIGVNGRRRQRRGM